MDYLQQLQCKPVIVVYRSIRYQGTLVDAGAGDVTLETSSGRVVLPMSDVTSILPFSEQKDD